MNRLDQTLEQLRQAGRPGLVCYFTAGDPDFDASLALLRELAGAGADLIELGLPFSDPVADGPVIQAAHLRARAAGQTAARTLELAGALRRGDAHTPLVLMGYLNPVMRYGAERFMTDAAAAGVDGLLLVDLPHEHAAPYRAAARAAGLHLLGMSAPTTDAARLARWSRTASGFLYHVALAGTTGAASCAPADVARAVAALREHCALPVAAGFGIREPEQARAVAASADLVVIGSRLVELFAAQGHGATLQAVREFATAIKPA